LYKLFQNDKIEQFKKILMIKIRTIRIKTNLSTNLWLNICKNENKKTSLWIHEHIPRIQRHSASARDAVSRSEALHISTRCIHNMLVVLQHRKLRSLLSLSSAFDSCKYDSNRAISDVDYQPWNESFLKLFQKWCSSTSEH
jgi:hypothetical protein